MDFITIIDYIGTFAFAISGIRLASAKRFDWFGAYVVGLVTSVGRGTIRELIHGTTDFSMSDVPHRNVASVERYFVEGRRIDCVER